MMRLRTACSIAIVGLASFAAGEDVSLSLADYKVRLQDYSDQVQRVTQQPEYADDFYRVVPTGFQVQTESGPIHVPLDFLHKALESFLKASPQSKPTILTQLAERIKAMRVEADGFEQARPGDPATRERLDRILAAREFGRVHGPTELELLEERIRAWFNEKMRKLFPKAPDVDQLGEIFVWIAIGIVTAILGVWLYRQSRERLLDRPREVLPFLPSSRSWHSWLAEARERAALGEWRDAIHLGFWAAVSRLESDGAWRPDKARTPREYLNAIPPASENKSPFAAVTRTFEAAWYGGRAASAGDFDRFMSELEKLGCRG
jgi:hypothetical protein